MRCAPYACKPSESRGRLYPEPASATRTAFQRDRDRIIHCTAFRRLMHKTQVFVHPARDHYPTPLTHTPHVAPPPRPTTRVPALHHALAAARIEVKPYTQPKRKSNKRGSKQGNVAMKPRR